jgi:hypothetical protein
MDLHKPSRERLAAYRPRVNYTRMNRKAVPDILQLEKLSDADKAGQMGELFDIDTEVVSVKPVRIKVGELLLEVYSPVSSIRDDLNDMEPGDRLDSFAVLGDWRGNLQVVIQDPSWVRNP